MLSIFREEETEREERLARCREVRREITRDQKEAEGGRIEVEMKVIDINRSRKNSCLSPIVEQKGVREESPDTKK